MHYVGQPPPRYFTPEEANAMLTRVRPSIERAAEHGRRMRDRIQRASRATSEAERARAKEEVDRLERNMHEEVERIRALGVEVKGLEQGLLDFPALRNGEPVYLCWRLGENRVEWWHPMHTGIAGRQRLTAGAGVRWEWRN